MKTHLIHINGIVQGVGFRPFVYNLAVSLGLTGTVSNTGNGVEIYVNTDAPQSFLENIIRLAPPLACITDTSIAESENKIYEDFRIIHTKSYGGLSLVPPDTAVCGKCAAEIFDPENRRYHYPFTNCTDCGPRYTIIRDMPYDRVKTTMSVFPMCHDCQTEYETPTDRRFHAQPNACDVCGPHVWCGDLTGQAAIKHIAELIDSGEIVAVKGLGGYHLMCDACNDIPILKLRELKNRPDKPLAVMCLPQAIKELCISDEEKNLILSPTAPIVAVDGHGADISEYVCPMSDSVGFMQAYTPLHMLLLSECRTKYIIATSGNRKDEPIAKDEKAAEETLSAFTTHFLHHNREIYNRCDDSLAAVVNGFPYIMRRARGLAPYPVMLPVKSEKCVLGVGAHLKSTVTLAKDGYAFVSQYIGDLDNPETCSFYDETVNKLKRLYGLEPELIVRDIHPTYYSSQYADMTDIKTIEVQHHIAHMFACMAENGLTDNVVGVILDGTGLAPDKSIWGGEFFVMKDSAIRRIAHMPQVAQPGLDSAAKHPSRMLVSYLTQFGLMDGAEDLLRKELNISCKEIDLIRSMIERNINTIQTTSTGRYFESLGALITGVGTNLFEAHAAMKLEGMCSRSGYNYGAAAPCEIFSWVLSDIRKGTDRCEIAEAVHRSFALWLADKVSDICVKHSLNSAVLSGGVFQNLTLLRYFIDNCRDLNINTYIHKKVPPNDSCISLGQAYFSNFYNFVKFTD